MNKNFYVALLLADETVKILERGENNPFGVEPDSFEDALESHIGYISSCLSFYYIKDLTNLNGSDVSELMLQKEIILEKLNQDIILNKLNREFTFEEILIERLEMAQHEIDVAYNNSKLIVE